MVKNLPAMWEIWVWSLGWEDPLEKEMTTHCSILPMDRGVRQATVHGIARVGCDLATKPQLLLISRFSRVRLCATPQPTRLPRPCDSPGKNTGVGCHFLLQCMKVKSESQVAQSCLTLRDPMDYTVLGILQARILEWVAFPFSRGSSQPRVQTQISCIAS